MTEKDDGESSDYPSEQADDSLEDEEGYYFGTAPEEEAAKI